MAIFSKPEHFQEHKQYVLLLKKALLQVRPDVQKKFLYFKKYPFGPKQLPLVLVDFDSNCAAALAKEGHKPTDEGLVSLTAQDELNFEPKRGNLKRIRIRKYFSTMGPGLKPVFVPPGETDEEAEAAMANAEQSTAGAPAPTPVAAASTPAIPTPAAGLDENQSKRRQLLAQIDEIQRAAAPAELEATKKEVLAKARTLAEENRFEEATRLLSVLAAKLQTSSATAAASPPKTESRSDATAGQQTATTPPTIGSQRPGVQPTPPSGPAPAASATVKPAPTVPSPPPPGPAPAKAAAPPEPQRKLTLVNYLRARANLRAARESAAKELQRLQEVILAETKGESFYADAEAKSRKLLDYLGAIDDSLAQKLDDATRCPDEEKEADLQRQLRALIQKQITSLRNHPLAAFVEKNPFGTFVVRQNLEAALSELDQKLATAAVEKSGINV